ncbi:MAG: hypothetical protein PHY41_06705 [Candidatus Cloacimonetes bacterium]|nr:hypothetical protein [Candidatus Cloacimonadota bacterium]MDY0299352.1 hypothetical protein [Candidatus Cloacimonadaceae bacterium]MCB5278775.1 hypothetical protein [Candidatus Cloacimonadota bacterium]MCK9331725.1 hypothetical protein [Candidatus Cloacimonadota bacterium]MDD2210881.1 hypothetical protein [Candidatus Cloacimonadota bacterium]
MRSFDRMEWPRRYKLKGTVLLLVVVAIIISFALHQRSNRALFNKVEISEISFDNWGSQFIELGYTIENKTDKKLEIYLLAKIWDQDEIELASALFMVEIPPHARQTRSKLFDRLNRSLKEGERPLRAGIMPYPKRKL